MQLPVEPEQPLFKVVAHYQNGRIEKGLTRDFSQSKDTFHIAEVAAQGAPTREILVSQLKGLFFVKDLASDHAHARSNVFDPFDPTPGRKIRIIFKDGEVMAGFTKDYQAGRPGFFVCPADLKANADRCYVVAAAVKQVSFL
jgi:hypothetical protein